jgi:hypothetical protein
VKYILLPANYFIPNTATLPINRDDPCDFGDSCSSDDNIKIGKGKVKVKGKIKVVPVL